MKRIDVFEALENELKSLSDSKRAEIQEKIKSDASISPFEIMFNALSPNAQERINQLMLKNHKYNKHKVSQSKVAYWLKNNWIALLGLIIAVVALIK